MGVASTPPRPKVGLHLLPLLEQVHQAGDDSDDDGEDEDDEEESDHAGDDQVQRLPCAPQSIRHVKGKHCLIFVNL